MPYDRDLRKRSLYAPDDLWVRFAAICERKKCGMNATLLALVESVVSGRVELQRPKRVGLRFRLEPEILTPSAEEFREKLRKERDEL